MNCWLLPAATVALDGLTEIELSTAISTVRVVLPLILPEVAIMVAIPILELLAKPVAALMVATPVSELDHVTLEEILDVELFE